MLGTAAGIGQVAPDGPTHRAYQFHPRASQLLIGPPLGQKQFMYLDTKRIG
jgi:hypothetical protein